MALNFRSKSAHEDGVSPPAAWIVESIGGIIEDKRQSAQ